MTAIPVATRYGTLVIPPHDEYVGASLKAYGSYCPAEFDAWRPYVPSGGTVVEVGANIGGHTFAFADAVSRDDEHGTGAVWAIEAQRALYYMLCGSVALTGTKAVWPRWCAAGAQRGIVRIPSLDYSQRNNFGGLAVSDGTDGDPVPMVPLDDMGIPRVDFLKIDVEGMELDVLHGAEGMVQQSRPVIVAECDRKEKFPPLLAWFLDHGYHAFWQCPLLGDLWPSVRSKNLLCLPAERKLAAPSGEGVAMIAEHDLMVASMIAPQAAESD